MTAFSLASPFASGDFEEVFSEINARIEHRLDEYRNICNEDGTGTCRASIIVAGLPRAELKDIDLDFQSAPGIADGIKTKSKRPDFMKKKGGVRSVPVSKSQEIPAKNESNKNDLDAINKFKYK
jgi:hypothetical protein